MTKNEYRIYLQSEQWQRIRKMILERDGDSCVVCGSRENLEIHHKNYLNVGNENLSDLTTLCSTCHALFSQNCDNRYAEYTAIDKKEFLISDEEKLKTKLINMLINQLVNSDMLINDFGFAIDYVEYLLGCIKDNKETDNAV